MWQIKDRQNGEIRTVMEVTKWDERINILHLDDGSKITSIEFAMNWENACAAVSGRRHVGSDQGRAR